LKGNPIILLFKTKKKRQRIPYVQTVFFFFSFKDIKAFANNFEKQKKSSKFNNFLPFKNNKVIGLKKVDWSNESL